MVVPDSLRIILQARDGGGVRGRQIHACLAAHDGQPQPPARVLVAVPEMVVGRVALHEGPVGQWRRTRADVGVHVGVIQVRVPRAAPEAIARLGGVAGEAVPERSRHHVPVGVPDAARLAVAGARGYAEYSAPHELAELIRHLPVPEKEGVALVDQFPGVNVGAVPPARLHIPPEGLLKPARAVERPAQPVESARVVRLAADHVGAVVVELGVHRVVDFRKDQLQVDAVLFGQADQPVDRVAGLLGIVEVVLHRGFDDYLGTVQPSAKVLPQRDGIDVGLAVGHVLKADVDAGKEVVAAGIPGAFDHVPVGAVPSVARYHSARAGVLTVRKPAGADLPHKAEGVVPAYSGPRDVHAVVPDREPVVGVPFDRSRIVPELEPAGIVPPGGIVVHDDQRHLILARCRVADRLKAGSRQVAVVQVAAADPFQPGRTIQVADPES